MPPPLLLIAIGNESRGDDAIAPLLLRRLQGEGVNERKVELLEDFQLQVEHAADLADREMVLFIDAGMNTPAPYSFYRAQPDDGSPLFSHAIKPEAVLATYRQVYGEEPPPSFVLCVCGESFELGESPSPQAQQRMEAAMSLLRELMQKPELPSWDAAANP